MRGGRKLSKCTHARERHLIASSLTMKKAANTNKDTCSQAKQERAERQQQDEATQLQGRKTSSSPLLRVEGRERDERVSFVLFLCFTFSI
jgi:hypothetical protein